MALLTLSDRNTVPLTRVSARVQGYRRPMAGETVHLAVDGDVVAFARAGISDVRQSGSPARERAAQTSTKQAATV